jgi:hypothetical protein
LLDGADVGEVAGEELRAAADVLDLLDHCGPALGVAAVDQDLEAVPAELERRGPADTGRRSCHQGCACLGHDSAFTG